MVVDFAPCATSAELDHLVGAGEHAMMGLRLPKHHHCVKKYT
jgi:hypothetical protein